MTPLAVDARLMGPWCGQCPIHLDALLAAACAARDNIPPAAHAGEMVDIEIPIERSACGRYHLASVGFSAVEERELKYINRRFPIAEAQFMGDAKLKRINLAAGPQKHYRVPVETRHAASDLITWWCVGDRSEIERLLALVTHVGRRRAVGLGRVREWSVTACEAWPGFPVLSAEGAAMRNLPLDVEGLGEHRLRRERVTYPYWLHEGREAIATPQVSL